MKYEVMRYRVSQGVFNFRELKAWMLLNLPNDYHEQIKAAKRAFTKHYLYDGLQPREVQALNWIAVNSEYCSIKRVK